MDDKVEIQYHVVIKAPNAELYEKARKYFNRIDNNLKRDSVNTSRTDNNTTREVELTFNASVEIHDLIEEND